MIYLNNAATSYPKPDVVKKAYLDAIEGLPSGQYRSAGVSDNADVFSLCRKRLGALMGIADTDRIYFASGSTEGLNALMAGLDIKADSVITTVTEHNSVLRPLYNLPGVKGEPALISCDADGYVDPYLIEKEAKKGRARTIILNHCSNVTGAVQDAGAIGDIARRYGLIYILDVSQSAGCIKIRADEWGVDALAFTGHKSLYGLQGTGGYYVRRGLGFIPFRYGGTGYDSSRIRYEGGDYEYEVGTQNAPGIAALSAAAGWLLEQGIGHIREQETALMNHLLTGLSEIHGVHVYGSGLSERGPVVSTSLDGLTPADVAYILQNSYGIVTRAGLQCAPLIHDHIGSGKNGTLRVSLSLFNTAGDIEALLDALRDIT